MFSFGIEVEGEQEEFRFAACDEAIERKWEMTGSSELLVAGRKCLLQHCSGKLSGERLAETLCVLKMLLETYVGQEIDGFMRFACRFMAWSGWEIFLSDCLKNRRLKAKILMLAPLDDDIPSLPGARDMGNGITLYTDK